MTIMAKYFRAVCVLVCAMFAFAFSSDWPCFHGSDRTNKSKETGLMKKWPDKGAVLLWKASGLGDGYSGVSVSNGIIYSAGSKNKVNNVLAFNTAGKLLWEKQTGKAWEASAAFARAYHGTRSTPTIDNGIAYYLSDAGLLVALDAKSGAEKWSVNLQEKYDAGMPMFGYAESPLIDGDRLYVAVYGKKATAVCLDKNTGKVIWESPVVKNNIGKGPAGYASFVIVENSGFRQIVAFTSDNVYSLDSKTGAILWTVPLNNKTDNNCTDIIYHDGHIFATTGYGTGSILIKLDAKDGKTTAEKVYETKLLDNHHGGVILHNGYVYGSGHESKGWFCLDFKTGKQMWNHTRGKGSVTFAEGMLYFYDEDGTMSLVKAQPEKFEVVSSFKVPSGGKGAYWAHPVVSNGVLYLRHADNLYAYDIKAK
ncbi:MAG: PQQ-binding-like beta-propeller repeat protein [Chitinispirillales bacterium]|jgi:outer membrane protein assembly factor BamB|nr:PQQ-binding-like beta-propeller repeat protein [Chitinispirillales bacterium]